MFTYMFGFGWLVILYCIFFQKELIRIEWNIVAKFSAFLLLLTAIRFALLEGSATSGYMPGFGSLPLVPWEDAVFSMAGIYFFKDYLKLRKRFWIPIAIASSVLFASGHIAYGYQWAAITLFFPYLISYKYGKKYGYGTAMVGHILYDFTTLLTVKLIAIINLLHI